ncbi:MAG: AsnC family transcriptional regulator [Euryarchaeota archaeon]|nr:AsnC family transcriptional regulator [Euryarchaeota archaeon]|tara:strand:+ start:158 stop:391 length:234 start_codon:yes stop_codon:yes gene_type:complete
MAVGYVLVNVSPGKEYDAFKTIKEIENVVDTTLLFGDYDIIAKLEDNDLTKIARTVVETIRQVPGVINTKTLAGADI